MNYCSAPCVVPCRHMEEQWAPRTEPHPQIERYLHLLALTKQSYYCFWNVRRGDWLPSHWIEYNKIYFKKLIQFDKDLMWLKYLNSTFQASFLFSSSNFTSAVAAGIRFPCQTLNDGLLHIRRSYKESWCEGWQDVFFESSSDGGWRSSCSHREVVIRLLTSLKHPQQQQRQTTTGTAGTAGMMMRGGKMWLYVELEFCLMINADSL